LNLASILFKKIIAENDVDAWAGLQKHYLTKEYSKIHSVIENHYSTYSTIPSFDDLKLSVRDRSLLEEVYSLEKAEDIDIPCLQLLEYLKNEFTQVEIMSQLDKYLETSVSIDNAEESLVKLQAVVLHVESKVELGDVENDMRRIQLFHTEEERAKNIPLSLNAAYDSEIQFSPKDLILVGGARGAGKSVVCANMAANIFEEDKSVVYFTIEMDARQIMQRICAISTNVSMTALRNKTMTIMEWEKVAKWWSKRFEEGEVAYKEYLDHRSFDNFHSQVVKKPLKAVQVDIIYDATLSLAKIRSEIDKKAKTIEPRLIIVDYINQVKRNVSNSKFGQYEWMEQIEISKALKSMAQHYEIPVVAPYQIDASGEARFAKGILDAADAAFTLNTHEKKDKCITFKCAKMRNAEEKDFTSTICWDTLKIGPETASVPTVKTKGEPEEAASDI
jgi:archaellum biogenesis ATPase FlaH